MDAASKTCMDTDEDVQNSDEFQSLPKRKRSSEVWDHFSLDKKDGKSCARCKYCDRECTYESSSCGTSSLNHHLVTCRKKPMFIDDEGNLRAKGKSISPKVCREWITKITIAHDLPFNWIESKYMRSFLKYLNSDVRFISRKTIASDVLKMFESEKEKLKSTLRSIPGMVCLTFSVWTGCTGDVCICLTAQFVDEKWKLNNKILALCVMPPPHNDVDFAQKIYNCLVDWGIDRKVFSLTLDNASPNDNVVRSLKSHMLLQNSLMCNGEHFHVKCWAHILNLIVQEGLKVASGVLDKIRWSLIYVKGSKAKMIKFQKYAKKVGIEVKSLVSSDVATRWNSTYLMLADAIKYRSVFNMLAFDDLFFHQCPSDEEWDRVEKVCEFLRPFYTMSRLISGSSYPTSNLYFLQVWKIALLLNKYSTSDDDIVREMANDMKEKFDEYWMENSEILAMGAVFDPRMKLIFVEYCYTKIDCGSSKQKVEMLKNKLYLLYEEYKKRVVGSISRVSGSQVVEREGKGRGLDLDLSDLNDYMTYRNKSVSVETKSSLDKYMEEELVDESMDIDLLQFWKGKEYSLGSELTRMACDVLSLPITTVMSESTFSVGVHVLNKYRNKLLPRKVQARICTHNWLYGYPSDDEEDGEDPIIFGSEEDSNVVEDDE